MVVFTFYENCRIYPLNKDRSLMRDDDRQINTTSYILLLPFSALHDAYTAPVFLPTILLVPVWNPESRRTAGDSRSPAWVRYIHLPTGEQRTR